MIRRNITLDDRKESWLLISQVEHARISGELAKAWAESYSAEVIDAITHHDDGWAAWEAAPQFDEERGRPLSFTELAIEDAIQIWDDSIASARRFGPLASAIVAGHFAGLAGGSEHASQPLTKSWIDNSKQERRTWLDEWSRLSEANTQEVAEQAQQMLYAADLLSLWLCMNGPVSRGGDDASPANSEMQTRSSTVLGKFSFRQQDLTALAAEIVWQGSLAPWPFASGELRLQSPAIAVPALKYASWAEIATAGHASQLRWELRETLSASGESR
jgi:Protein of unknown function (DUF3891)